MAGRGTIGDSSRHFILSFLDILPYRPCGASSSEASEGCILPFLFPFSTYAEPDEEREENNTEYDTDSDTGLRAGAKPRPFFIARERAPERSIVRLKLIQTRALKRARALNTCFAVDIVQIPKRYPISTSAPDHMPENDPLKRSNQPVEVPIQGQIPINPLQIIQLQLLQPLIPLNLQLTPDSLQIRH